MMIRAMHEVNNGNADYYGADTTKTWLQAGVKIIRNVLAERHSPRHLTTVIKRTLIIITHLKEALLHIDANRLIVAP
jgi:hypothetical protein